MHFVCAALLSSEMITRSADYVEYCRDTARRPARSSRSCFTREKQAGPHTPRPKRIVSEVALTADD
jgi:hypothetical protein